MAKAKTASNTITIYSDGTWDPPGGIPINPGGVVKFDVEYPGDANTCIVPFGTISFSKAVRKTLSGSNTIKVGSGSGFKKRK
ncbi:MAG TPA: hypothetical protein VFI38_02980 [Candidatus Acidoferrum sp.]|nr:hypothetical protein [Candidatus Acidoferrum sp.]